jgi:hypothetical protein
MQWKEGTPRKSYPLWRSFESIVTDIRRIIASTYTSTIKPSLILGTAWIYRFFNEMRSFCVHMFALSAYSDLHSVSSLPLSPTLNHGAFLCPAVHPKDLRHQLLCSLTPSVPEVSTIIDSCGLWVLPNRNHIKAQACLVGATALEISHRSIGREQLLSCGHELSFNSQCRSGAQAYLVFIVWSTRIIVTGGLDMTAW